MNSSPALQFGTAGIRGRMGPGADEINPTTVTRVAAGVAAYLGSGSVVIGYDGRRDSDTFARLMATALAADGLQPRLLPRALPTPVLAASIRSLGCVAGLMVTASHNPAADNGIKVYLGDGIQIVPPADSQIAELIASVPPERRPTVSGDADAWIEPEDVVQSYIDRVVALVERRTRDLRIAHTALHGVGWEVFSAVMSQAGFTNLSTVPAQQFPNPDFPTTPFPNPELAGVLDQLLAHADAVQADLAIAHDPDADRCAAAVRDHDGTLVVLSGDELGAILGWWVMERMQEGTWPHGGLATSIVSATLLEEMAQAAGLPHQRTLTGFKWIARVPGLAFGYEEALGYCLAPDIALDKDGISAALILAEACSHLRSQKRTAVDVLDDLAAIHGRHITGQRTVRADRHTIAAAMESLRLHPPAVIGGSRVTSVTDYLRGTVGMPPTDLIGIEAEDLRLMIRPSGTEPLLKCYAEAVVRHAGPRLQQQQSGRDLVAAVLDEAVDRVMTALEGTVR